MKKCFVFFLGFVLLSLPLMTAHAQEGFNGPGSATQSTPKTISEAKKLPDDAWVVLRGKITRALGDEKYEFRDDTGTITVEIDQKVWRGLSVDEKILVEIQGEVDRDLMSVEIDVKKITILSNK
ncbi:MAG: NirD/YgiW/YdeI family stress tolerance protein [Myxococcales bacterium]|jgi:uncharacterized protein (TIGR00156 family)|nr:NirD/YgiW/YdeI family stress tolerance protein [Myxococcales bacterium]